MAPKCVHCRRKAEKSRPIPHIGSFGSWLVGTITGLHFSPNPLYRMLRNCPPVGGWVWGLGFLQALKWVGGSGVWGFLCGRPPPVPRRGQGMGALAVGPAALSIENAAAQSPRRLPPSAPRRSGKEKKKQHFCCVGDSVIYRHGDAGHGRPLRRPPRAREGAAAREAAKWVGGFGVWGLLGQQSGWVGRGFGVFLTFGEMGLEKKRKPKPRRRDRECGKIPAKI